MTSLFLGPELPDGYSSAKIVTSPDGHGVIFIGGVNSADIYELRCPEEADCEWTKLEQNLKNRRDDFIPIYVPNDFTNF